MVPRLETPATPTAYELLCVHPNAPAELIAASYWLMAGNLQTRRAAGQSVDADLHELTRAYESVSDPLHRTAYDSLIGHAEEPLVKRKLPRRRSLLGRIMRRPVYNSTTTHHEVLGVTPLTPPELLSEAYRIMRDNYLRLPSAKRRAQLQRMLDDAFATLSSPDRRSAYEATIACSPVMAGVPLLPPDVPPADHRSGPLPMASLGAAADSPPLNPLPVDAEAPEAAAPLVANPELGSPVTQPEPATSAPAQPDPPRQVTPPAAPQVRKAKKQAAVSRQSVEAAGRGSAPKSSVAQPQSPSRAVPDEPTPGRVSRWLRSLSRGLVHLMNALGRAAMLVAKAVVRSTKKATGRLRTLATRGGRSSSAQPSIRPVGRTGFWSKRSEPEVEDVLIDRIAESVGDSPIAADSPDETPKTRP